MSPLIPNVRSGAPSAPLPRTSEWLADALLKWAEEHRSAAEELADKLYPPDLETDAQAA